MWLFRLVCLCVCEDPITSFLHSTALTENGSSEYSSYFLSNLGVGKLCFLAIYKISCLAHLMGDSSQ